MVSRCKNPSLVKRKCSNIRRLNDHVDFDFKLLALTPCFSEPGCRHEAHLQFMRILKFSDEIASYWILWAVHNHQPSSEMLKTQWKNTLSWPTRVYTPFLTHCSITKPSYCHVMGCNKLCCQMYRNDALPKWQSPHAACSLQPPYHRTITWTLPLDFKVHSKQSIPVAAAWYRDTCGPLGTQPPRKSPHLQRHNPCLLKPWWLGSNLFGRTSGLNPSRAIQHHHLATNNCCFNMECLLTHCSS